MEKSSITPKDLKSFGKLVKAETEKVTDAMMDGEDVSQLLLASYLLFQKEIDNALKNKNIGGGVDRRPNDNLIFETPG